MDPSFTGTKLLFLWPFIWFTGLSFWRSRVDWRRRRGCGGIGRDRFAKFSVGSGMIRRELGDAVRIVDSVFPGMIRRGRSRAVAWLEVSRDGKLTRVSVLRRRSVAPGMICREQRGAVGLAVSVVEGCRVVFVSSDGGDVPLPLE